MLVMLVAAADVLAVKAGTFICWPECRISPPALSAHLPWFVPATSISRMKLILEN
jgi:hypothetical protein